MFDTPIIEKILFFLVINKKCSPLQLREVFQNPLYEPNLIKSFSRLEKGNIIISHREGKALIYQFNPRYPFLSELESFLKKSYSFLPEEIREKYYEPSTRKRPRRIGKPLN